MERLWDGINAIKQSYRLSQKHGLDISIRYTFNAQKSKYKGTGAGKAEQQRMGSN